MANVKSIIAAHLSQRQRSINKQVEREDLLGQDRLLCNIIRVDSNNAVPSRPGFVWCQEYSPSDDTSPFHVFNDKVQAREGLTVWVGPGLGGRREVLDWNNGTLVNTADYAAQKYLPIHHSDHEWPDFKPGPDVVNVYPRSLSMLRTYPGEAGALTVSASPLRYIKGNALVLFPGKNSLDISAAQPASGLARFVGIYLDPDDNILKSVNGATTGDSPAITPDSPAFPESAILSANVRLNGDQSTFSEVDIVDVRQILDSSGAIDGTRVSKLVSPDGSVDPVLSVDDNGDIGAGVAPSAVAKFRLSDASGPQLRLEFDATKYADFTVDTSHNLTIDPSSTGVIKLAATVTIIDEIQHEGDLTSKMAFATGQWDLDVTGINMIRAHNTSQDVLYLGDVAGDGDVDVNFSNGRMFLQGSDGLFKLAGDILFTKGGSGSIGSVAYVESTSPGAVDNEFIFFAAGVGSTDDNQGSNFILRGNLFSRRANQRGLVAISAGDVSTPTGLDGALFLRSYTSTQFYVGATQKATLNSIGLGVNDVTSPSTAFDIGAGAIGGAKMTDPGAGAINTYRLFAEDNGAGKTRLMVRFATGAAQQVALQP